MDKQTFTTSLHRVCADDMLRPIMMCVHFKDGFAYATDGYMAIKQSLEYHTILNKECLENKSIHKDNYKEIMSFEFAECDDNGVACKDTNGRVAYYEFFDRKGEDIPDFEKVMRATGQKSIEFIGINPKFLSRLAKAMRSSSGGLRLKFQGVNRPILIDTPEIANQWGLLMPVIINDRHF